MPTALSLLPENLGSEQLEKLIEFDGRLQPLEQPAAQMLRIGIVAVLARSGTPRAMKLILASVSKPSPIGGKILAIGLAQQPDGENWSYLVRALPVLEGGIAREVLAQLSKVDRKPEQPEPIRQVILCRVAAGRERLGAGGPRIPNEMDGAAVRKCRFLGSNDD